MASTHSDLPARRLPPEDRPIGIDGQIFREWMEPASSVEFGAVLREASKAGRAVTPVGGGTKLALGNKPANIDLAVSTIQLNRILHYEPTDMTLSVEAGMRFADLQMVLGERGQSLPIEAPDEDRATIGGLIATAMAGPRRLGSGTLRDLLIGISVAYSDGTIAKAGGLVVKNVTGFDLMRLHLGALGTLGVIVSANFKVLPVARVEQTFVSGPLELVDALALAAKAKKARVHPIAIEIYSIQQRWKVAVRIEGRAQTLRFGSEALESLGSWPENRSNVESQFWWKSYVDRQSIATTGDIQIRGSVVPKAIADISPKVLSAFARWDIQPNSISLSPGLGTLLVRFDSSGVSAQDLTRIQQELENLTESTTILSAPAELKSGIDVWGRVPETISVMRALKTEFDPTSTLKPWSIRRSNLKTETCQTVRAV